MLSCNCWEIRGTTSSGTLRVASVHVAQYINVQSHVCYNRFIPQRAKFCSLSLEVLLFPLLC